MAFERMVQEKEDPRAGFTFLKPDGSEQRHYPFSELLHATRVRGHQLVRKGLGKGDRVALVLPDPEDFVLTFLAATCAGMVPVPMFPPLSLGKLEAYLETAERILRASRSRVLVTSKKVQHVLWTLVDRVPSLEEVLCVEELPELKLNGHQLPTVSPEDPAFLQFTSGSTSMPKGVVVSHRSLGANLRGIMEHGLKIRPSEDVAISWLPLYHDMGLIGFMLSPLCWGVATVFIPTLSFVKHPTIWLETVSKYKGTLSFAPNFAYALARRRTSPEKRAKLDLSRVRAFGCGAEPNHPGTLRAFAEYFEPAGLRPECMLPVYGMAEATLAMSFCPLSEPMRVDVIDATAYAEKGIAAPAQLTDAARQMQNEPNQALLDPSQLQVLEYVSCGFPFPEHGIRIIGEDGRELPDRHVGEVVFMGPSIAEGYFENPEASAQVFRPDGLRTGDLGYLCNGELFVTGRKKDIIILNGRNYDPQTIEWLCADIEGVRKGNIVAFSRPAQHSEELVVVAETRPDADTDSIRQAVVAKVRAEIGLNVADVVLLAAGELPKTSSGKLQRAKTRAQYLDASLGAEGVRALGGRGDTFVLAKQVARSFLSRVRHNVKKRSQGLFGSLRSVRD
jgi:fatty-acyl-CoA synthase